MLSTMSEIDQNLNYIVNELSNLKKLLSENLTTKECDASLTFNERLKASLHLIDNEMAREETETFFKYLVKSRILIPVKNEDGFILSYDWTQNYKHKGFKLLKFFYENYSRNRNITFAHFIRAVSYFMNTGSEKFLYHKIYNANCLKCGSTDDILIAEIRRLFKKTN
jgi:hypothetical protein